MKQGDCFIQADANEIAKLTRETAKIVRNANAEFYRNPRNLSATLNLIQQDLISCCPACHKNQARYEVNIDGNYYIRCQDCNASTENYVNEIDAMNAWLIGDLCN